MHKPKPIQAADTLWGQGRRAMKDPYGPQTRGCEGACAIKTLDLVQKTILTGIALEREKLEARTLETTLKTPFLGRITTVPSEAREHARLMDIESASIEDGIEFLRPRMNRQGKANGKILKDLVTHISIRRIANRKNSQTMRDLNREIGQTFDEISASQERLAGMSIEADSTTSTSIRCASEATSQYPLPSNTTFSLPAHTKAMLN
ncbi:uncharacterized protein ARMOST_04241 [Armillaria ostoyae]|uniref:Uncharacterized protein n=1 Tax=Armillaria ostoyae TaxID=47428 RepID=A0A284QWT5_ARMOS|nr:uncharacterized protein ARMOST_04241 [Armillaria ostoyae]